MSKKYPTYIQFYFRVSVDEREELNDRAKEAGMTPSAYVREKLGLPLTEKDLKNKY